MDPYETKKNNLQKGINSPIYQRKKRSYEARFATGGFKRSADLRSKKNHEEGPRSMRTSGQLANRFPLLSHLLGRTERSGERI